MKALQLISGMMDGGGQRVALDLCRGLGEFRGVDVDFGLLGCRVARLESQAAFVVPYAGDYSSVMTLAATALKLRRVLQQRRYDVIHTHGWDADIIARLALAGERRLHVIHLHVTPSWTESGALKHRFRRLITRQAFGASSVRVVAVSEAVRSHWGRAFPEAARAMRVVHNGVDVEMFRPRAEATAKCSEPAKPFVFGVACRLAPIKGLTYLLEAVGRLRDDLREFRFDIGGEGPEQGRLEAQAGELGLGDHVRFLGPISPAAMPDFYHSIDALVLPSVSDEGFPLVVLEAMACGLPVIASDVGGTKEAVRSGLDGWVVPPRDPEALASALMEALQISTDERTALSERVRARVCTSFSLAAQSANMLAVYGTGSAQADGLQPVKAS